MSDDQPVGAKLACGPPADKPTPPAAIPDWEPLPPEITAALALARSPITRERMPMLEHQLATLSEGGLEY